MLILARAEEVCKFAALSMVDPATPETGLDKIKRSFFVSDYNFLSFHVSSNRLHLDAYNTWLYSIKLGHYIWTTMSLYPLNTEISPNHF